jgi:hypothetical protein
MRAPAPRTPISEILARWRAHRPPAVYFEPSAPDAANWALFGAPRPEADPPEPQEPEPWIVAEFGTFGVYTAPGAEHPASLAPERAEWMRIRIWSDGRATVWPERHHPTPASTKETRP